MKNFRLPLTLLICSCLILLPCTSANLRAQNTPEDGKKVFSTYSTVVGMVYPAAGAVFKATGDMLDLFGYFGNGVDPVGEEIKRINERLGILDKRISDLENGLRRVENNPDVGGKPRPRSLSEGSSSGDPRSG